jgi:GDPmannose 4,6-dehydratase
MVKKALITGITGQDGSYLAEFLLSKGYAVHGFMRRASTFNTARIDHLYGADPSLPHPGIMTYYGDVSDGSRLTSLVAEIKPDEIYNLAAQSHVRVSFDMPSYTGDINAIGTTRLLETLRLSGIETKFYQASSSEMFGSSPSPQNENTPFHPRSPYAIAKLYAHWMTVNYREGYNLFASTGILFNHESPRRGQTFVTRKVTTRIAEILAGRQQHLYLGNLKAKRDWGYTPEYIEAIWKILQKDKPDDYVLGTGESHSVEEFVEQAFAYAGLDWKKYVKIDARYFRPTEVEYLVADSNKAIKELDWKPKITFNNLVKIMVDADMRATGLRAIGEGDKVLKEKFPHRWWKID